MFLSCLCFSVFPFQILLNETQKLSFFSLLKNVTFYSFLCSEVVSFTLFSKMLPFPLSSVQKCYFSLFFSPAQMLSFTLSFDHSLFLLFKKCYISLSSLLKIFQSFLCCPSFTSSSSLSSSSESEVGFSWIRALSCLFKDLDSGGMYSRGIR